MIDIERRKRAIEMLPIEIVTVREMVPVADWNALIECHQPRRIAIRQRLDQGRIDKGKDGGAARRCPTRR